MACPATAATWMFRRHTIRGIRRRSRRTLCAMRSAPRNGAVALGRMSHRPLEALQKAQQPLNGAFVRGVHAVVDGVALASSGWPCDVAHGLFPVLSTQKVGTMVMTVV